MRYRKTFAEALEEIRIRPKSAIEKIQPFMISYSKDGQHAGFEGGDTLQDIQNKAQKLRAKGFTIDKMGRNNPPVKEEYIEEINEPKDVPSVSKEKKEEEPKEKDPETLEAQIITLKGQLSLIKQKLENEKNKSVKPMPNPLTGEVPLRTGLANAILKIKDDAQKEQNKTKQVSKQIKKLSRESLDVVTESDASDKAKGMGLDYMSFGRYGKDGKVTHKNIGGSLTAVDKDEKPVKEPKSAKPKDEPKKSVEPKTADDSNVKSRQILKDFEDDFDFDDEASFEDAIDKARETGASELADDLERVAGRVADMEDDAQAEYQDVLAKYSGKEVEAVVQSKNADKAIDLMIDQEYSASNVNNMVTDLKSTFDIIQKMVDSDETEGDAGSGMTNSKKGFRPEVIDTLQSLEDISSSIEDVRDELDDEDMKSKLSEIQDEIGFIVDDGGHDDYTKPHKVNGSVESIRDILKDIKSVKEETTSYRIKSFKGFKPLTEDELTAKDLTKKPSLDDVLKNKKKKKEIKVGGKTKIEVNPNADIGVFSGGVNTNLH